MKRFFAVYLLLLFLVYNAGYYVFYLSVNAQYEDSWRQKVELNDINPDIILTKSIPITLAYQADQENFQPVLESFEMDGKVYRILQQRYAKDTLHIVYINDQTGKQIKNSLRDWISTLTEKPSSSKNATFWDCFEKNYISNSLDFSLMRKAEIVKVYRILTSSKISSPFIDTLTPPPKA